MGHISLPVPVVNIALFKILAANLSKLLGIPTKKLEDIVYLRAYVVIDNGSTSLLKKKDVLEKKLDLCLINDILQEIIQDKLFPIKEKLKELIGLINQFCHEINQLKEPEKVNKIKEVIATFEKKLEKIKKDEKSNIEVIAQAQELSQNLV